MVLASHGRQVGELLEVGIGPRQFVGLFGEIFFRLVPQAAFGFLFQGAADYFRKACQAIFQNVISSSLPDAFDREHVPQCARHQDQRDIETLAAKHVERFHSRPIRQVVIGEHDFGRVRAQRLGEGGFVLNNNRIHVEAVLAQRAQNQFRVERVVFHEQGSQPGFRTHGACGC
jgi:hypothetical protein